MTWVWARSAAVAAAVGALALTACGGSKTSGGSFALPPQNAAGIADDAAWAPAATGPIQHIVVIVQENRSFDNLFRGYPGADSVAYGWGHGKRYALKPRSMRDPQDVNHSHLQFLEDYNRGRMDGFDRTIWEF